MEWLHTKEILDRYTERMIQLMDANLSGTNIKESSTFILEVGSDTFEITFHTLSYYKYIEEGRKAGSKMPPVTAIQEWITKKRITPRQVGGKLPSEPQLAFLIARKIGRDGIEGKHYLRDIQDNMLGAEFDNDLTNALVADLNKEIDVLFTPLLTNGRS